MNTLYWTVRYENHQYIDGVLVLVKEIPYVLQRDTLSHRDFVVNMNNCIIYLDQFDELALVKEVKSCQRLKRINFSTKKRKALMKKKKNYFYSELFGSQKYKDK
ncbi:hypothetical protein [Carnobacterium maltaromaticum]|uniref:hypothetical protein n=1 Tax=Carnobacterium maltaromaticum TaxID=2751 RepID=UPI0039B00126